VPVSAVCKSDNDLSLAAPHQIFLLSVTDWQNVFLISHFHINNGAEKPEKREGYKNRAL